ncbi:MAG: class I SAM-dependent methyltransferase [Clostridiaceae bacterium]
MSSSNEKIRFKYKILSKVYGLMDTVFFFKKQYNPRYNLAERIPNCDISVLDVCFGTGNTSITIAKKNPKNRIIGIDLSKDMLKVAEKKVKKFNLNNISTFIMDATNISFDEKFDIVTTSLSLHEMSSKVRSSVISQMSSLLKDDGKLYIIEWNKPNNSLSLVLFMIFPYLSEPKGFGEFLTLDWTDYLNNFGLKIENIEIFGFTKLIIASKLK